MHIRTWLLANANATAVAECGAANGHPVPVIQFERSWGEHGSKPGEFDQPKGMAVDAGRHVYVADANNHRVQKFTADGMFT